MKSASSVIAVAAGSVCLVALLSIYPVPTGVVRTSQTMPDILRDLTGRWGVVYVVFSFSVIWCRRIIKASMLARTGTVVQLPHLPGFVIPPYFVVRVLGDPELVVDHGFALESSPRAVYTWESGRLIPTIVIPALYWRRLREYPVALAAVMAHEIAHFKHRDMWLLAGVRDIAFIVVPLVALNLLATIWASVNADISHGEIGGTVVQAAVVGNSYSIMTLAFVLLTWPIIHRIDKWREALADAYAQANVGEAALAEAEMLIEARVVTETNPARGRPSITLRRSAIELGAIEIVLAATIASVLSSHVAGLLLQWSMSFPDQSPHQGKFAAGICNVLTLYAIPGVIMAILIFRPTGLELRSWEWITGKGLLLSIGWCLGFVISQATPLVFTSLFMPEQLNYFVQHDPLRLIASSLIGSLTNAASANIFTLVGVGLAIRLEIPFLCLGPGIAWVLITASADLAPVIGLITPVIIQIVLILVSFAIGSRGNLPGRIGGYPGLILISIALLGWLGFGDSTYLARAFEEEGKRAEQANRLDDAEKYYMHASLLSYVQGRVELRLAQCAYLRKNWSAMKIHTERALAAPFLSAWNDILRANTWSGMAGLQLTTPSALEQADRRLSQAENMWRTNSRLCRGVVADALYLKACAIARFDGPQSEVASRLLEAFLLSPKIAVSALTDSDLSLLKLASQSDPRSETIDIILAVRSAESPQYEAAVEKGIISSQELVRLVALIARNPQILLSSESRSHDNCDISE